MSSRKQSENRNRRRTGQFPAAMREVAFDPTGNPVINPETGQIVVRMRPNRALRRRAAAERRRELKRAS